MNKVLTLIAAAAMAFFWTTGAMAHDFKIGDIEIGHPWARASAGAGKTGAAYLTLVNGGSGADRLVAARSAAAKMTGLHQSLMENGIMKMLPVKAISLPPGAKVELKPGGYHIMFMGLKAPLMEGDMVSLTLVFEKAGEIEIKAMIMKAGTMKMNHAN